MWFYWAVFAVLFLATGLAVQYQNDSTQVSEYASLDSLSRNLLVYRSAAAAYAQANPGFTGFPADAALSLPGWFFKPAGVVAYLAAGQSYTYFAGTAPVGLPSALVERTQSLNVGVKRAGVLVSPVSGQTGISLPAAVPEGAVVAVN